MTFFIRRIVLLNLNITHNTSLQFSQGFSVRIRHDYPRLRTIVLFSEICSSLIPTMYNCHRPECSNKHFGNLSSFLTHIIAHCIPTSLTFKSPADWRIVKGHIASLTVTKNTFPDNTLMSWLTKKTI